MCRPHPDTMPLIWGAVDIVPSTGQQSGSLLQPSWREQGKNKPASSLFPSLWIRLALTPNSIGPLRIREPGAFNSQRTPLDRGYGRGTDCCELGPTPGGPENLFYDPVEMQVDWPVRRDRRKRHSSPEGGYDF